MKILQITLTAATAVIFAGCLPDPEVTTPPASPVVDIDKFDASTYPADTVNTADITGTWLMTTQDALFKTDQEIVSTGDVISTQIGMVSRQTCKIIEVSAPVYDFCGEPATLSGTTFTTNDGSGTFTLNVDNNRMLGSISMEDVDTSDPDYIITFSQSATYDFVKIGAADLVVGTFTAESEGTTDTLDIAMFGEGIQTFRVFANDELLPGYPQVTTVVSVLDALDQGVSVYLSNDGDSAHVSTASFMLDDYSETAVVTLVESTSTSVIATFSGYDFVDFSGSIDVSF